MATMATENLVAGLTEKRPSNLVNPVRNSSGALNPAGIVLKCNPAAEQQGIISNGVNKEILYL